MRFDGRWSPLWRVDPFAKASYFVFFSIYMEVGVSTLHPFTVSLFLTFIPLFFVIQTTIGRKDLGNIHCFMYTGSFTALRSVQDDMTMRNNVKNPPFHRRVNRVKGSGVNFHVYVAIVCNTFPRQPISLVRPSVDSP